MPVKENKTVTIMSVGPDMRSDGGGLASVVQNYYRAYAEGEYDFKYVLARTIGHKNENILHKNLSFIKGLIKILRYCIFERSLKLLHIHSSSHKSFLRKSIVVLIAKAFRKRTIIHLHSSRFYEFFMSDNKFISCWISFIFNRVDLVVALCRKWELELKVKYPDANITTVHNPIVIPADRKFMDHLESRGNELIQILFLAFLSPNKGVKDLLKVAEHFEKKQPNIKFIIAGTGKLESYLKEKLSGGQHTNVEFFGWADSEAKNKLYAEADLFFLPSYNEGMPVSILEAMSFSLPVVSTTISGIPDEVVHGVNGFLYSPGDIEGFCHGIKSLISDNKLYCSACLASWEKVQKFSSSVKFKQIADLYKSTIAGS